MDYATVADLISRFGERELIQLTDRSSPPADAVDQAVAQAALSDAFNLIDGYVLAKYSLPLAVVPALLNQLACDLARYNLYTDQAPEQIAARNTAAIKTLRGISDGSVKIDVGAAGGGVLEPESREPVIVTSGPRRMFTRDGMRRF